MLSEYFKTNKSSFILSMFKFKPIYEYDLNMDFRSFDNGFKQLCVTNFILELSDSKLQDYPIHTLVL